MADAFGDLGVGQAQFRALMFDGVEVLPPYRIASTPTGSRGSA